MTERARTFIKDNFANILAMIIIAMLTAYFYSDSQHRNEQMETNKELRDAIIEQAKVNVELRQAIIELKLTLQYQRK